MQIQKINMTTGKLNNDQLKQTFVHNLNRMYYGKIYLEGHMSTLIKAASFNALKMALTEMHQDVKNQISRMADIYTLINEMPDDVRNNPIKSIVKDEFCLTNGFEIPVVTDMDIILYVQILEHINITAYRLMKMTAPVLNNTEIEQLLTECFDESVDDDQLFVLITKEYIG